MWHDMRTQHWGIFHSILCYEHFVSVQKCSQREREREKGMMVKKHDMNAHEHTGDSESTYTHSYPANEWVMMRWHTWSQTVRCSEKWMGWRGWRTGCKSAGATDRLTSSWSCSRNWCWHPEACRCKTSLRPQALWHSRLGAFAWTYRRMFLEKREQHITGKIQPRFVSLHVWCWTNHFCSLSAKHWK